MNKRFGIHSDRVAQVRSQSDNRQEKRMKNMLVVTSGIVAMILSTATIAGPREDLLAQYAAAAGQAVFRRHAARPCIRRAFPAENLIRRLVPPVTARTPGVRVRALTGKTIEPVAVSVAPTRYTDPAKVEKWFKRNCTEVLGRECTPQKKGDWLTFVIGQ